VRCVFRGFSPPRTDRSFLRKRESDRGLPEWKKGWMVDMSDGAKACQYVGVGEGVDGGDEWWCEGGEVQGE
jgi:hypothetical protein